MGSLTFPFEYPWKPPTMKMITKTGRFYVNKSICLSITNYHPESWDPIWPVKSLIVALISFFVGNDMTAGAIPYGSFEERKKIRDSSRSNILKHPIFMEIFESFKPNIGLADAPSRINNIIERKEDNYQQNVNGSFKALN
mgnify:CR=1 FL=1